MHAWVQYPPRSATTAGTKEPIRALDVPSNTHHTHTRPRDSTESAISHTRCPWAG